MSDLTRREFVTRSLLAAAVMQLPLQAGAQQQQPQQPPGNAPAGAALNIGNGAELHWLDGGVPAYTPGATWGVPWPSGAVKKDQTFALKTDKGDAVPMQSWPLAFWSDGSLKWTAHAIGPNAGLTERLVLAPGTPVAPQQVLKITESAQGVEVDTGVIKCKIARTGSSLIESIERDGKQIAKDGQLVVMRQDQPSTDATPNVITEKFTGDIEKVTVEQSGPMRGVVKIEGKHKGPANRAWLPFVVRFYFYAGGDSARIMHTFIFDGDEKKDFIRGLGVRFTTLMRDQLQDRHVRFVGEGKGLFAEGVRGLTGLRRDAGNSGRNQVNGQQSGGANPQWQYIPAFGDYSLTQLSSDGFEIRKRTGVGFGWVKCDAGKRAAGVGYVGSPSGGLAFGIRDFWQKYPAQLDVRGAAGDQAEVTMWLYSPEGPAMDLRFYHDVMGMDTYAKQYDGGLAITYEDYEPGFGTPVGIARTSEMMISALPATPSREQLIGFADAVRRPPLLASTPQTYLAAKVFGGLFSLPDRSNPVKAKIEDQLDFLFDFYAKQVEQRRWYGFWDYGDVIHSYDTDRHVWKYDVGGFAWDNSELSTDLWLWYAYLRSGRADIFRFAEAMGRHTGEVDVYHLGRFRMLGTRHGVQHWGDSAKQLRISTPVYRRFYYYLTADERVGDLMHELVDADETFITLDPIRKIRQGEYKPDPKALGVSTGTDWGSLLAGWLTEWERTGNTKYRDKILAGMKTVPTLPKGFFSGDSSRYDMTTGAFTGDPANTRAAASHLNAVFGQVEINAELLNTFDDAAFEKTWLQYCELYNAGAAVQTAALGNSLGSLNLGEAHSRLTAYAAYKKKDAALAQRAWTEFFGGAAGYGVRANLQTQRLEGPTVLNPVDEAGWVSTNASAQWGLTAIQILALVGDSVPAEIPARGGRGGAGGARGGAGRGAAGGGARGAAPAGNPPPAE